MANALRKLLALDLRELLESTTRGVVIEQGSFRHHVSQIRANVHDDKRLLFKRLIEEVLDGRTEGGPRSSSNCRAFPGANFPAEIRVRHSW